MADKCLMMQTTNNFNAYVTCPHPNPQAALRLFCFPYAGGSSGVFRTWFSNLPTTIEVCPVELPGRGTQIRLSAIAQLEPLLDILAPALLPYLDKPFAFFGHSMGGLISFEVVRLLRKKYTITPAHLFISAHRAPQIPDFKPPIHALSEPAFKEELRRLNGTPQAVLDNAELMELFLPTLRADFKILETYIYTHESPLECPITVFGGLQDVEVSRDHLLAWQAQTLACFSLQMLAGDHFFIHSNQQLLLEHIGLKLTL